MDALGHLLQGRLSSEIAADIIQQISDKEKVLARMHAMVGEAIEILNSDSDICEFGKLLNQSWQLKRQLSARISNDTIDKIYGIAMEKGAVGGKLLGAGASGFMVFFASPEHHDQIKDALPGYLHVPFGFETQGSTLIHYTNDF